MRFTSRRCCPAGVRMRRFCGSNLERFEETLHSTTPRQFSPAVSVSRDSIDALTAKFGKPTRATVRPDIPHGHADVITSGTSKTVRLRVTTVGGLGVTFFTDDTVETVEVWGPKLSEQIGTTGRGLQLGTTVTDVGRLYGSRFGHEATPKGSRPSQSPSRSQ